MLPPKSILVVIFGRSCGSRTEICVLKAGQTLSGAVRAGMVAEKVSFEPKIRSIHQRAFCRERIATSLTEPTGYPKNQTL
jgi:hypothetical protein